MGSEIIKLMTWKDVREIVQVWSDTLQKGISASEPALGESICKMALNELRQKYKCKPPIAERYHTVLAAAEQATGWKLTNERTERNTIIRSFISFRLHNEGYTFPEIGKMLNRNHSTIINLRNKVVNMTLVSNAYKDEMMMYRKFNDLL